MYQEQKDTFLPCKRKGSVTLRSVHLSKGTTIVSARGGEEG